ncbi:hypothetical protein BpHYR1_012878 [Brachionus plicatilis]|uniref:Uncharacterized protein n=1 Tax=Brachionus plicatilis TaxID=10195 RepID=A0A3M7QGP2_BRAPC|nr:hypothetical protein BpHYR1_012878 [Brachionus plicatilis]
MVFGVQLLKTSQDIILTITRFNTGSTIINQILEPVLLTFTTTTIFSLIGLIYAEQFYWPHSV